MSRLLLVGEAERFKTVEQALDFATRGDVITATATGRAYNVRLDEKGNKILEICRQAKSGGVSDDTPSCKGFASIGTSQSRNAVKLSGNARKQEVSVVKRAFGSDQENKENIKVMEASVARSLLPENRAALKRGKDNENMVRPGVPSSAKQRIDGSSGHPSPPKLDPPVIDLCSDSDDEEPEDGKFPQTTKKRPRLITPPIRNDNGDGGKDVSEKAEYGVSDSLGISNFGGIACGGSDNKDGSEESGDGSRIDSAGRSQENRGEVNHARPESNLDDSWDVQLEDYKWEKLIMDAPQGFFPIKEQTEKVGVSTPRYWPPGVLFLGSKTVSTFEVPKFNQISAWYEAHPGSIEVNPLVEIKESEGRGLGCFAVQDINQHKHIGHYSGVRQQRYTSHDTRYAVQVGDQWEIDAEFAGNEMRFINCPSRQGETANVEAVMPKDGRLVVVIVAKKAIKQGEELLWYYGEDFYKALLQDSQVGDSLGSQ